MPNVFDPTGKQIRETAEKNARWAAKQAKLKWDRTENHPLFEKAKQTILNLIKYNSNKMNEASIWYMRRFMEPQIDCAGQGLFHRALLALEREGKVELLYREPARACDETKDPLAWFIPGRDRLTESGAPCCFNAVTLRNAGLSLETGDLSLETVAKHLESDPLDGP